MEFQNVNVKIILILLYLCPENKNLLSDIFFFSVLPFILQVGIVQNALYLIEVLLLNVKNIVSQYFVKSENFCSQLLFIFLCLCRKLKMFSQNCFKLHCFQFCSPPFFRLKSTYEHSPGNSVSRNEIYSDYLTTCTKTGRKDIVNANVFAEFVK